MDTNNLEKKKAEGTFIPRACVDWSYDEDDKYRYKFSIHKADHHLFPSDMVVIKVWSWPLSKGYHLATVIDCEDNGIIVQTHEWLDISEEYSIELID